MASFLIFLVLLGLSVGLLSSWRRNRKLVAQARSTTQVQVDERTNELERANEDLKRDQAELRRRWEDLAEAQRLSHAGTFGWKVRSGQIVWGTPARPLEKFKEQYAWFARLPELAERVRKLESTTTAKAQRSETD